MSSIYNRGSGDGRRGRGDRGDGQRTGSGRTCGDRGFRPETPIVKNVRQLPTDKVEVRRVRGTQGTSVDLIVNHYRIQYKDMHCFHYDIELRLRRHDGNGTIVIVGPQERKLRKGKQMENIRVIEQMAIEWPQVFTGIAYVFDGNKHFYCGQQLAIGLEDTTRVVTTTLDGFPEQAFEVRIKFVKEVDMNVINNYFNGLLLNARLDMFREALQVLDIAMRYCPTKTRVPVGRNLYSKEDRIEIKGQNSEIAFGHHQSIQLTECGLTLNVDRTATLFRSEGKLVDYIKGQLNVPDLKRVNFTTNIINKVNRSLKGLKIFTQHIRIGPTPQKRSHLIDFMIELKPNERRFTTNDGQNLTIADYFLNTYQTRLEFGNIPCIQLKGGAIDNKKYLPVEICYLYPDQPVPKSLITQEMTRQIVSASSSQTPLKRFDTIQQSLETITTESQDLMQSFGLNQNRKLIQLKGRVLNAPIIIGSGNKVNKPKQLTNYLFYNLSQIVNQKMGFYFNKFFGSQQNDGLIKTARGMGITISTISANDLNSKVKSGPYKSMTTIDSAFKRAKEEFNGIQMIFFCIPQNSEIYSSIKYFGDIKYGIPTQCILEKNFVDPPRGYFSNILLKINAKLDGQNQVLAQTHRPDVLFTKNINQTMIVGVDVTHPGTNPLANERVISSIAACVATYDSEFTKFVATISAQPMNTEIIADFDVMFGRLLKQYFQKNGNYPKSVVVFRDGVSDGQFPAVMSEEIPLIEKAFKDVRALVPKITVLVVQKRHHTRFLPVVPLKDRNGKEIKNISAGTVVDHTIVNPLYDEFHLCSHKGLLGTSRHAKYFVLRDDHKLNADQKQMLSYYLCYTYCRCTTPISIPTPVMYAHLVAYRAKQHIAAQNDIAFEESIDGEDDDQRREREGRNIRTLNDKIKVNPYIVFIPYYC